MVTVAAVIIGDEILSGKVADTNSATLIALLRDAGAELVRLVTIGDDPVQISREVRISASSADFVITSGGLGPTHDDRTIAGVARAFNDAVVRHPDLERQVRKYLGERINDIALKMADVPEGAELLEDGAFPTIVYRNIFILPGVPQLFRAKVERLRARFAGPVHTVRRLFLRGRESDVAPQLAAVDAAHAAIKVGSYPRLAAEEHQILVTVEGPDGGAVAAAVDELLALIPAELVVRAD